MLSDTSNLAATTRRGFLRLAGSAAAFTALAQLRGLPAGAAARSAAPGSRFFAPDEVEILTQIVERMVDTGEARAPRVRETATIDTIDALCGSLEPALTQPLPTALLLFEWGPIVLDLSFARFSHMTAAERDASLAAWMTSRFLLRRQAFYALRNLAFLGYYTQEEVWPLIGYAGPLLGPRRVAP